MAKTKKNGRPTKYTKQLADKICSELALGFSMRTVSGNTWSPSMATIFSWLRTKPQFLEQYEKAKQESTDAMAEDIMDIADNGTNDWEEKERADGSIYIALNNEHIQRSRLRVDTRKWLMAKMKPKKYGEKVDVTTDGEKIQAGVVILPAKNEPDNTLGTTE